MFYIYKYIIKDECVYIGKTTNLPVRHSQHINQKNWIDINTKLYYLDIPDKNTMNFLELFFLNKLKPRYNIVSKDSVESNFIDLYIHSNWKEFNINDFQDNKKTGTPFFEWKFENKYIEIFENLIENNKISRNSIIFNKDLNQINIEVKVSNISKKFLENFPKNNLLHVHYRLGDESVLSDLLFTSYTYLKTDKKNIEDLKIIFTVHLEILYSIVNKVSILFDVEECVNKMNFFLDLLGLDINTLLEYKLEENKKHK